MINIPLEIGDIIFTGRFKNKRQVVKEITLDRYGHPLVNGKSVLKFRIQKLMQTPQSQEPEEEEPEEPVPSVQSQQLALYSEKLINKIIMGAVPRGPLTKNPGLLEIPKNRTFDEMTISHYISIGKRKGKDVVMRGLTNMERWNKKRAPEVSDAARDIIDKLLRTPAWVNMNK